VNSDRRQDVVKPFEILRSDGIFPSAVTLGQHTRAIAEGCSKQSTGKANFIISKLTRDLGFFTSDDSVEKLLNVQIPNALDFLDGNLIELDEGGSRWRQDRDARRREMSKHGGEADANSQSIPNTKRKTNEAQFSMSNRARMAPSIWIFIIFTALETSQNC